MQILLSDAVRPDPRGFNITGFEWEWADGSFATYYHNELGKLSFQLQNGHADSVYVTNEMDLYQALLGFDEAVDKKVKVDPADAVLALDTFVQDQASAAPTMAEVEGRRAALRLLVALKIETGVPIPDNILYPN